LEFEGERPEEMALQTREATSAGFSRLRNQEAVRML